MRSETETHLDEPEEKETNHVLGCDAEVFRQGILDVAERWPDGADHHGHNGTSLICGVQREQGKGDQDEVRSGRTGEDDEPQQGKDGADENRQVCADHSE